MGIYDRDYYRQTPRRGGFASFSMWSVTTWLIVINVAVFLLDSILVQYPPEIRDHLSEIPPQLRRLIPVTHPINMWGYFSMDAAVYHVQVWRFFTFQFLHANFNHLLGNMFSLFLFGPIVEAYFGSRRYLAFYLLSGMAGAVSYILLFGVLGYPANTPLVGASAGIFGVLVAAALIAPNVEIILLFPPIPIQIKYLAIVMMGVAAYTVFAGGYNAGGEAAHLGGGVVGYLLLRYQHLLNFAAPARPRTGRVRFKDWSRDPDH